MFSLYHFAVFILLNRYSNDGINVSSFRLESENEIRMCYDNQLVRYYTSYNDLILINNELNGYYYNCNVCCEKDPSVLQLATWSNCKIILDNKDIWNNSDIKKLIVRDIKQHVSSLSHKLRVIPSELEKLKLILRRQYECVYEIITNRLALDNYTSSCSKVAADLSKHEINPIGTSGHSSFSIRVCLEMMEKTVKSNLHIIMLCLS